MSEEDTGIPVSGPVIEYFKSLRAEKHVRIAEHTRLVAIKLGVLGGVISFLMVRSYDRSSMPSLLYLCWIIPVAAAVFDIHCGPFVFSAPGNPRSETTVRLLELDSIQNRLELIGRKMERLEHIKNLVEGVSSEVKPTLKRILIEDLEEHCSAESEYSGMVRTFVDTLMPHGWANNAADTCEE